MSAPEGIHYSLGLEGFEMTNGAFTLGMTDSDGPHYSFFDNVENETEYHIAIVHAFEYLDDDENGIYEASEDTMVNPSVNLQISSWSFGGFASEAEQGTTTSLQFNLSSIEGFAPHQPSLRIVIQNRITAENANVLKFGLTIEEWSWSRGDSNFAITMTIGSGARGQQMQKPIVNPSSNNLTFGNGFFSYDSQINYGMNQGVLNVSLGGASPQGNSEQIYLCFPHFGEETLECDPIFGLIQSSPIPTTTQTTTQSLLDTERFVLLAGGTTVILLILVLVQSRRN